MQGNICVPHTVTDRYKAIFCRIYWYVRQGYLNIHTPDDSRIFLRLREYWIYAAHQQVYQDQIAFHTLLLAEVSNYNPKYEI